MNTTRPRKERMPALLALVLYALAVNAVLIQTVVTDEASPLKTAVRLGALAAVALVIVAHRVIIPLWVALAVGVSLALLLARGNPDQLTVIFVLLAGAALAAAPERALLRHAMYASWVALGLIFALLAAGLTQNNVTLSTVAGVVRARASYGTAGVPFFMNVVYGAAALTILFAWKYGTRRAAALLASLGGAGYLFIQTDGRGGFFALLLFVFMLWFVPATARFPGARTIVALLPALMLGATLLAAAYSEHREFDLALSLRPRLYRIFLDNITDTDILWSTSVKQFDERVSTVTTVDNSYLHLLVGAGILVFAVFCIAFCIAARRMYEAKRYPELAFLIATLGYCASESILLRVENVFILVAWSMVVRYARARASSDAPSVGLAQGVSHSGQL